MPFDALLFDLDDTLVVEVASAEAAFVETCAWAQERCGADPEQLHNTLRKVRRALWHKAPERAWRVRVGVSSWEALWARFDGDGETASVLRGWAPGYRSRAWYESLLEHGVDDAALAGELAERFPQVRRTMHEAYDDTHRVLADLKGTYKLGLVTNGASCLQREKIDGADVGGYFDAIAISGDLGIGKPDLRIFESVLDRLDVEPEQAAMVGNSLNSDIRSAQAAGIHAVWLNRAGKTRDDSIVPDLEIANLDELTAALEPGGALA